MAQKINGVWVYDANDKFNVETGQPLNQSQVIPPRNDLQDNDGAGYNRIAEQFPNYDNNSNSTPDNNSKSGINNTPFMMGGGYTQPYVPVKTLSSDESAGLGAKYGLNGIAQSNAFEGLTQPQAERKAQELKNKALGQTSQLTSYVFNPETISGSKKALDNLRVRLQETTNDPWLDKSSKTTTSQGLFESAANDFAKLFNTPEDFGMAYQNDMQFRQNIDAFVQQGGDINSITNRIAPKSTIQDQEQSLTDYLSNSLSPDATPAQQEAYNSLIPETKLAQEQIMQLAQIPKQYKDLFFGSEEQIGLLEERKIQAEERKKVIATQIEREKENVRAQAQLTIEQNNADFAIADAEIQKNRIAAKNYMTGMLAKLGALNTTGAAPEALASLEQKYQQQSTQMRMKVTQANRATEVKLTTAVNELETAKEEEIYKVQEDLSKDKEDVLKEVAKLEQVATKEIFNILSRASRDFRTQTEKYEKEAKALVDKDLKERQRVLEKYNPSAFLNQYNISDTRPQKDTNPEDKKTDQYKSLQTFPKAFRDLFTRGLIKEGRGLTDYTVDDIQAGYDGYSRVQAEEKAKAEAAKKKTTKSGREL